MKQFELKIEYRNGEIDEYYTRLTGKGWETSAQDEDAALAEMKELDPETFADLDQNDNVRTYWVEELAGTGRFPTALEILKEIQNRLQLNQRQLGTYIGVSIRTISNWMTGTRQCPIYVAEMAARLAGSDLRALDQDETTSEMFRWCVISSRGIDEWIQPCGSKADALRQAESDWNHLTAKEKESQERFMVGFMHVCYEPGCDGPFSLYTRADGSCDGDVYEVAKDYLA